MNGKTGKQQLEAAKTLPMAARLTTAARVPLPRPNSGELSDAFFDLPTALRLQGFLQRRSNHFVRRQATTHVPPTGEPRSRFNAGIWIDVEAVDPNRGRSEELPCLCARLILDLD